MSDPLIRGLVLCCCHQTSEVLVGVNDVERIEEERFSFKVWISTEFGGESLARSISRRYVIEVLYGLPGQRGENHDS